MRSQEQRIVVGVDGSGSSKAALRWAIRQAKLTGSSVEAVTAWRYPAAYGLTPGAEGTFDFEANAKSALVEALAEVSGLEPDVPVRPLVTCGVAAEVLLHESAAADLLVVGSRGHGGFASALLGSVSMYCALHAHCPVLVLRDGRGGSQLPRTAAAQFPVLRAMAVRATWPGTLVTKVPAYWGQSAVTRWEPKSDA